MDASSFPAIDALNCPLSGSLAVEASAGTGKTWLICSLFLRLVLESNQAVSKILVVTFTNAACYDLKLRIRERLEQSLSAVQALSSSLSVEVENRQYNQNNQNFTSVDDDFLPLLIEKLQGNGLSLEQISSRLQLANLSLHELQIFTIHAFCQKILEQIPFSAKLHFSNEIVNFTNDDYLCQQIVQRFWLTNILQGSAPRAFRELFIEQIKPSNLEKFLQRHWLQPLAKVILPAVDICSENIIDKNSDNNLQAQFAIDYLHFVSNMYQKLLSEGIEQLAAAKQKYQQQSPSDSLRQLWQLLNLNPDQEHIAEIIHQIYPFILIDEFQDTDQMQYAIFRAINSQKIVSQSFFLIVGDPKQAIYRFRQADVYSYLQARDASDHCYALLANYRSQENLLQAINHLFTYNPQAMVVKGLTYQFLQTPGKRSGEMLDTSGGDTTAMQCWQISLNEQQQVENYQQVKKNIAAAVANEIARLLIAREQISIDGQPIQEKDLIVIVGNHRDGQLIKDHLMSKNIYSQIYSTSSIFASEQANSLGKILLALLNFRDISLIKAALVSNVLAYNLSDIIALNNDQFALAKLVTIWQGAAQLWRENGIFAALNQLNQDLHIMLKLAEQGERALTNYNHLCELLFQAEKENAEPLQLWRWLRKQIEEKPDRDESLLRLQSDAKLVNIMTIHRVKGLEFSIVFCPFLAFYKNTKESNPWQYHDNNNLIIDYRNEINEAIEEQVEIEAYAEQVRLVYVAMTRAKYRCYLVCGHYLYKRSIKQSLTSPVQWLLNYSQASNYKTWWNNIKKYSAKKINDLVAEQKQVLEEFAASCVDFALKPLPTTDYPPLKQNLMQQVDLTCAYFSREITSAWHLASFSSLQTHHQQLELPPALLDYPALEQLLAEEFSAADDYPSSEEIDSQIAQGVDNQFESNLVRDKSTLELENIAITESDLTKISPLKPTELIVGTLVGSFFHYVLERVEWQNSANWQKLINEASDFFYRGEQMSAPNKQQLHLTTINILHQLSTCILHGEIKLAEITAQHYQAEMEFIFPLSKQQQDQWQSWMQQHHPLQGILFNQQQEITALRGFIDYLIYWQGKYYIIDWKSNYLGDNYHDYQENNLLQSIDEHGYLWQSLIYSCAVHRYLKFHLPDYKFAQHFGGCLIIFLRGINQQDSAGQYFWRPEEFLLDL